MTARSSFAVIELTEPSSRCLEIWTKPKEAFAKMIAEDDKQKAMIIKDAGIKVDQ